MENRNTILKELKEISPAVAEIGFQKPYQVPARYFEGLPELILARLKDTEGEEVSPVLNKDKVNPYQVPNGYFENFAASLLQRIKAEEASSAKEELEALSPLLSGLSKRSPFSTPAGYFEELTENAVAGAQAIDFVNEELENLSPLMNSLKSKKAYEAPAGYFERLPEQLLQKAKSQAGRVVPMNFTRKVLRYAAAAVVAGLIIMAAWLYIGRNATSVEPALAGIEEVSDEVLNEFIANQTVSPAETSVLATASVEMESEDLQEMFADLSDEELQKFVEKYSPKDILTN